MRFLCIHTFEPSDISRQQLEDFAQLTQQSEEVKGIQSFINLTEGKAVCVIESASKGTVEQFFKKYGMPYDSVSQIEVEGQQGEMRQFEQPGTDESQWTAA